MKETTAEKKTAAARKKASSTSPRSTTKKQERESQKKVWYTDVYSVRSQLVRLENEMRARKYPSEVGWTALIRACRELLWIDITALCAEFDQLHGSCWLPVGMVHRFDEPVNAHFTQHDCCEKEPTHRVCALARCLFVLAQAVRALRAGGWRRTLQMELTKKRGHDRDQEASYVELVENLKQAMNLEPGEQLEKVYFIARLEKLAEAAQARREFVEKTLGRLKGHPAIVGIRGDARPSVLLAEAELTRGSQYDKDDVARLIHDERSKSRKRQVRRHEELVQWTLVLRLVE